MCRIECVRTYICCVAACLGRLYGQLSGSYIIDLFPSTDVTNIIILYLIDARNLYIN